MFHRPEILAQAVTQASSQGHRPTRVAMRIPFEPECRGEHVAVESRDLVIVDMFSRAPEQPDPFAFRTEGGIRGQHPEIHVAAEPHGGLAAEHPRAEARFEQPAERSHSGVASARRNLSGTKGAW